MKSAAQVVVAQDLTTSRSIIVSSAASEPQVYQAGGDALETTITEDRGRLTLQLLLRDTAQQQNRRVLETTGDQAHLIGRLDALAKEIDSGASRFSTQNEAALKAFCEAMASSDPAVRTQRLRDAIAADSSFGLAYIELVQTLTAIKNADAGSVLADAAAHLGSFTALDSARFDLLRSKLLHQPIGQQTDKAAALVKIAPNDAEALATLGSLLFLQPARAAEAQRTMTRALAINPDDANLRQQFATGLLEGKRYAEAEKIFTSIASNTAILPQLAVSIYLGGDEVKANAVFQQFLSSVSDPNVKPLLDASWRALTGHASDAIQILKSASFSDPRLGAIARNQIVVWQILLKQQPHTGDTGPITTLLASDVRSAAEWQSRVDALPPTLVDNQAKLTLLAYGLFLHGFYPQAAETWREIESRSGGTDLPARAMLAASLRLGGNAEAASKIPVQPFVPDLGDFYGAIAFGQMRLLLHQAG